MALDSLESYCNKRIEELGLVNPLGGHVISISTKDLAIDGFKKMFYSSINAVVVIDEKGKIVANLSVSDLRNISEETIEYIRLPVLEFLKKMNGTIANSS